jgi:hypothetical protein
MKKLFTFSALLLAAAGTFVLAQEVSETQQFYFQALDYEQLPHMPTPRLGHVTFPSGNDDIVVVGGHTTGFELTQTAEILHDGQWTSLSVNYPHDGAAWVELSDGRKLITGGFSSGWGVGESSVAEIYDPATQTFTSVDGMVQVRAFQSMARTGIGDSVLVCGNWYADDNIIELWNGTSFSTFAQKDVPFDSPAMVSNGQGTVYVFGSFNNYGSYFNPFVYKVDTRTGQVSELTIPALEGLKIHAQIYGTQQADAMTADGKYLFLVQKTDNNEYALMSFDMSTETATELIALPGVTWEGNGIVPAGVNIYWRANVLVNKERQEAYVMGYYFTDQGKSVAIMTANLATGNATLHLGGHFGSNLASGSWAIQPSTGNLIITGGSVSDNFDAVAIAISVKPFAYDSGLTSTTIGKAVIVERYSLDGRRLSAPQRGINVLRMSDGTTRKVLVK